MLKLASRSSLVALLESIAGLHALEGDEQDLRLPQADLPAPTARIPWRHQAMLKRLLAGTRPASSPARSPQPTRTTTRRRTSRGRPSTTAPFADRLEEAVRKDPALADLTNDKGQRAIDLACLECRSAMQKALFFLGRYDVDKGPPEHRSATSLVVRAVDHAAADDYGKLFDEFDDGDGTLDSNQLCPRNKAGHERRDSQASRR